MNRYHSVIEHAVATLQAGGTLLYPTDTIWGLGCDATLPHAVEKLYDIKSRDRSKSMLILCSDLPMVERYVGHVDGAAATMLCSEGRATTVILPLRDNNNLLASNLTAADGTIGVRMPRHALCQTLLQQLGHPIVSTSANRSGLPSPQSYAEIGWDIVSAVDFCIPKEIEEVSVARRASRIVKVSADGSIQVIRE